jgi:hypothetical protein
MAISNLTRIERSVVASNPTAAAQDFPGVLGPSFPHALALKGDLSKTSRILL